MPLYHYLVIVRLLEKYFGREKSAEKVLLDLGCGKGFLSYLLAKGIASNAFVIGIDISDIY
ncbi:MAG: methyltransferase domain-containing protein [Nitrososphaerales archaeon]